MKFFSSAFLVLLRLAIGWHFLVEGVYKINTPTWSSAGYLRDASGPLAPLFRDIAGDPVIDKMVPLPAEGDPAKVPYRQRLPRALAKEWQDYHDRFVAHYEAPPIAPIYSNFTEEQKQQLKLTEEQKKLALVKFEQRQDQTARWLIEGKKDVVKPSQFKQLPRTLPDRTTPQRIQDYQEAVKEVRRIEKEELPKLGEAAHPDLLRAKAEAARQRGELLADLNEQTAAMKVNLVGKDLYLLSTPGPWPASILSGEWSKEKGVLSKDQVDKIDRMPDVAPVTWPSRWDTFRKMEWLGWSKLEWSDFAVRWGLILVGGLLLLGLFTRTACIGGAAFLVLFYLPSPPWPGLPAPPGPEHNLYVNKNIIEVLALLALAFAPSGRWVGIDGLLASRKARKAEEPPAEPKREVPPDLGRDTPRPDLEPALANGPATDHADKPAEPKTEPPTEPPTVLYTTSPKEPSHGD